MRRRQCDRTFKWVSPAGVWKCSKWHDRGSRRLLESTAMTSGNAAEESQSTSLIGSILEPGSSFNPAFLLVVDGAFASLFAVLVALAVLTQGNVHLLFLIFIELALWASVKWYVTSLSDSRRRGADANIISGSYTSGTWCKVIIAQPPVT